MHVIKKLTLLLAWGAALPALAGSDKLLLTGGVTQLEGAAGGGLVVASMTNPNWLRTEQSSLRVTLGLSRKVSELRFEFVDLVGLRLRRGDPLLHCRQVHDALAVGGGLLADRHVVGQEAGHHRRVHCVGDRRLPAEKINFRKILVSLSRYSESTMKYGLKPRIRIIFRWAIKTKQEKNPAQNLKKKNLKIVTSKTDSINNHQTTTY